MSFNIITEQSKSLYERVQSKIVFIIIFIFSFLVIIDLILLKFLNKIEFSLLILFDFGIIILFYVIYNNLYRICLFITKKRHIKLSDELLNHTLQEIKEELEISIRTELLLSNDEDNISKLTTLLSSINRARTIKEIMYLIGYTDIFEHIETEIEGMDDNIDEKVEDLKPEENSNIIHQNEPKEFKIDDFITLKLEKDKDYDDKYKTNIYINGEKVMMCKYLLLNVDTSKSDLYDDIKSIDDLQKYYNKDLEGHSIEKYNITPEEEFVGHCSNIQAWVENDYDTRILHSNLSFPLLKKLVEVGCSKAKKIFKEEIIERLVNGNNENVRKYLIGEKYLNFFTINEILDLTDILLEKYGEVRIIYENKEIIEDSNSYLNIKKIFDVKSQLKNYYLDIKPFLSIYKSLYIDFKVGVINIIKITDNKNHQTEQNFSIIEPEFPHHTITNIHANIDDEWAVDDDDWDDDLLDTNIKINNERSKEYWNEAKKELEDKLISERLNKKEDEK